MLTLKDALEQCRNLWALIRDRECTNTVGKKYAAYDLGIGDYYHRCPLCQWTLEQSTKDIPDVDCTLCPILEAWGKNSSQYRYACLNYSSPYRAFEFGRGTPELANKIVEACEAKINSLQ